jgi:molybdate transport system substrate-binding protein
MSVILSSSVALFLLTALSTRAGQVTLTIAAAADLAVAEVPLQQAFERQNAGTRLRFVNGASAALANQIEQGAPYDVFLSANVNLVEALRLKDRRTYAIGHVALLFRDHNKTNLTDLNSPDIRFIAFANPKLAPYGLAAQEALERASLWDSVKAKVVYAENVRQALQLFDSGNADAVLTAAALVGHRKAVVLEQGVVQEGGIVATSEHKEQATRFLDWLVSPEGQKILAQFGFTSPNAKSSRR